VTAREREPSSKNDDGGGPLLSPVKSDIWIVNFETGFTQMNNWNDLFLIELFSNLKIVYSKNQKENFAWLHKIRIAYFPDDCTVVDLWPKLNQIHSTFIDITTYSTYIMHTTISIPHVWKKDRAIFQVPNSKKIF